MASWRTDFSWNFSCSYLVGHLHEDVFLLLKPELILFLFFFFIFEFCNPSVFWITKALICTRKQNPKGFRLRSTLEERKSSPWESCGSWLSCGTHSSSAFSPPFFICACTSPWLDHGHTQIMQLMWIITEFFEFGKFLPFSVLLPC